jgi:hypothetical protein
MPGRGSQPNSHSSCDDGVVWKGIIVLPLRY